MGPGESGIRGLGVAGIGIGLVRREWIGKAGQGFRDPGRRGGRGLCIVGWPRVVNGMAMEIGIEMGFCVVWDGGGRVSPRLESYATRAR